MSNTQSNINYSVERYPAEMKGLPEEVRRKAIKITNDMLMDGNIRYHRDFIILVAIQEAKRRARAKLRESDTLVPFTSLRSLRIE
ncbi:MAG: hypothetical protein MUO54_09165 [Anaerolineales bacterium]|nr:hypothetical protein [Anaerolineales bacterium]